MTGKDKNYPSVAIIILNWNGWEDTIECLESLLQIEYPNFNIVVVDNGSDDNSVEKIKGYLNGKIYPESKFLKSYSEKDSIDLVEYERAEIQNKPISSFRSTGSSTGNRKIILLKNEENLGFSGGNNVGMRFALKKLSPTYMLLLNNDTVVDEDFLHELVQIGEKNDRECILNPIIRRYRKPKEIQIGGVNFRNRFLMSEKVINDSSITKEKSTDMLSGCSLFIPSKIIKKIGLLDETVSPYGEDVEYSYRAKKYKIPLFVVPTATIYHKGDVSFTKKYDLEKVYFRLKNRFKVDSKYFGTTIAFINSFRKFLGFCIHIKGRNIFLILTYYLRALRDNIIENEKKI